MILDLVMTYSDDGVTAEIPSIKGCEVWAHNEDEATEKIVELLEFYLNRKHPEKIKIDLARKIGNKKVFKLVFEK